MRKISIINYKGGTGKTSTVVNLAHSLSMHGQKVLIVDTDPQGSSGIHLGIQPKNTIYDLLTQSKTLEECITPARQNLDIIASNERLFPAELSMSQLKNREHILSKRLNTISGYQFVLVDCAPSINLLNQNALLFSNEVFLPVSMAYLSLVGVRQLIQNLALINKLFNHKIHISKVIPTFFNARRKASKEVLQSISRAFPNKIGPPIRMCTSIAESSGLEQTVFEFKNSSNGAVDYLKLCKEVLQNG
ncbi:MAG: ParA family protein [Candidatus Margulisbacteria bacterium]|nr:ParA family protein [Candidatus Margulisiibacteriota bacterium]